ncbi:Sac2 family-domain-containing protein [Hyaloraphidium curvatum]|nr:Sac2 family-domain-containing protein [Hyaloraphidium curvatum]
MDKSDQERALVALGLSTSSSPEEEDDVDNRLTEGLIDGADWDERKLSELDQGGVKDAVLRGVDLRLYAKQVEEELQTVEDLHIVDYIKNSQLFADLHSEIQGCDTILARMEALLSGFHAELGAIGTEIQALQEQSDSWSTRHKNRAVVQQQLNNVLEGLVVSPELIRRIADGEVGEVYVQAVAELDKKIAYVKSQQGKPLRAFRDVGPELERLRLKAADKIRTFFAERMKALRSHNANLSIVQQSSLLKFKELFWFLVDRHQDAASDLRQSYMNTVEAYYYSHFEKYIKTLAKLQIPPGKSEFLGQDEAKKGLFAASKPAVRDRGNVYSLGDRIQVLSNPDPGIIVTHVAEASNQVGRLQVPVATLADPAQHFPYEVIFKSFNRLLLDNAASEYVFISEFFQSPRLRHSLSKSANGAILAAVTFVSVFGSTLELLLASIKSFVEATTDAIAVLLAIRMNQQHQFIMQRRQVPCLESYFNAINMLLWPRFQMIMDMHVESVRRSGTAHLVGNNKEVHPHYVSANALCLGAADRRGPKITRRYAEFASSILSLNQGYEDPLVLASLARLRGEVDALLLKMSGEIADKKSRLIFMINNYDLVLLILNEHSESAFDGEKSTFQDALGSKTAEYVEEELRPHFSSLIAFVTKFESVLTSPDTAKEEELARSNARSLEEIAAAFNRTWKNVLAGVNTTVIHAFPNFQNGSRVLQSIFTRLVVYYQNFLDLWQRRFGSQKPSVAPVNLQTVLLELKVAASEEPPVIPSNPALQPYKRYRSVF